jgi:hypothetical protein
MNKLLAIAAAAALATSAGAATPGFYSGRWPVAVTHSQSFNGLHCLVLTDDGSAGFPHSGGATLAGTEGGVFQIIGHTLLVSLEVIGSGEEVATYAFSAPANDGLLGQGVWGYLQGLPADSGKADFGTKGGC